MFFFYIMNYINFKDGRFIRRLKQNKYDFKLYIYLYIFFFIDITQNNILQTMNAIYTFF